MKINLSKRGPAFWFLGDPKNLIVSLNQSSPSADVDFDSLKSDYQLKILNSLKRHQIECSESYQDLYGRWSKEYFEQKKKEAGPDPAIQMRIEAQKRMQERRQAIEEKRDKQAAREEERCQTLLKRSFLAVRTSLKDEKDTVFLKKFLNAERANRNRKSVIQFLERRIVRIGIEKQQEIERKVNRAVNKQLKRLKSRETLRLRVIESEKETVVLTPEDLIAAANEK